MCACKYVFVIALPVARSRDYRKSHRVVACTYVFTQHLYVCASVSARARAYRWLMAWVPGAGTRARAMQIARTCTESEESSKRCCSIMQKAANNYAYLVNHYY